jgi:hypothetical protein
VVVPVRVEDEFAQELTRAGVADPDAAVLNQEQDRSSGVLAADADVVNAAVESQGDGSGLADILSPAAIVGVVGQGCGCRLRGNGVAGLCRCGQQLNVPSAARIWWWRTRCHTIVRGRAARFGDQLAAIGAGEEEGRDSA